MLPSEEPKSGFLVVCSGFYYLLPILVAGMSVSLMSMHMKYLKLGINMAANNGLLYFFVAPALASVLYAAAITSRYLANRVFKSQWPGLLIGAAAMIGLGLAAFWFKAQADLQQTDRIATSMAQFLDFYMRHRVAARPGP